MPNARKYRKRSGVRGRAKTRSSHPVVADEPDLVELEGVEQRQEVGRQLLLFVSAAERAALAIAAQIGHDQPVTV